MTVQYGMPTQGFALCAGPRCSSLAIRQIANPLVDSIRETGFLQNRADFLIVWLTCGGLRFLYLSGSCRRVPLFDEHKRRCSRQALRTVRLRLADTSQVPAGLWTPRFAVLDIRFFHPPAGFLIAGFLAP